MKSRENYPPYLFRFIVFRHRRPGGVFFGSLLSFTQRAAVSDSATITPPAVPTLALWPPSDEMKRSASAKKLHSHVVLIIGAVRSWLACSPTLSHTHTHTHTQPASFSSSCVKGADTATRWHWLCCCYHMLRWKATQGLLSQTEFHRRVEKD